MKWLKKRTITVRILLLLLVCLIPINLLFFLSAILTTRTYREEILQANEGVLNVYAARIQAQMDSADAFFAAQVIGEGENLFNLSDTELEVLCMSIYNLMQEEAQSYEFATGMFVFAAGTDRVYLSYEGSDTQEQRTVIRESVQEYYSTDNIFGWQLVIWGQQQYLIRCYQANELCFGIVMPTTVILETVSENFSYDEMELLITEAGAWTEASAGNLLVSSTISSADFELVMELPERMLSATLPLVQRGLLAMAVVMFALIPILFWAIRRLVLRPLVTLDEALHIIEGGNLEYRILKEGYAPEFIHIYQSFNQMMDDILKLQNEKLEYERERQQHEMISLQLQIKPHFLYNSFNDISNMALVGDYGGIRELMGYLAEYFRYTIRTGYELVPLRRELEFLNVYLSIMEMRHPGCFEYEEEIDPRVRDIEILPLIIHTFVENTMTHSVKEGSFITCRLVIRPVKGRIRISVSDDGEGIPEESLQQIEQKKKVKDAFGKEHVGIWNCYKRLQIYYHGDADITITSENMMGTLVEIDMPWETAGEEGESGSSDRG